jgi:trk system potassium uptake protein TrkH
MRLVTSRESEDAGGPQWWRAERSLRRGLQIGSLLAVGILVLDVGFRTGPWTQRFAMAYGGLCFGIALALSLRIWGEREGEGRFRRLAEWLVVLLLLTGAVNSVRLSGLSPDEASAGLTLVALPTQLPLLIFSLIELSKSSLSVNRLRIHPALVFLLSFLVVILAGTGLLLLPNATVGGISLIDAFFTATSAVCVTGLSVRDTAADFTLLGQLILLLLIQVGGLGMMTFTSLFGFLFRGSFSLHNQLFLRDYINEESIGEVGSTLLRIIFFTILVEGAAALLIFFLLDAGLVRGSGERLFFAVFHAVSAFCNAGFSTLSQGLYEPGFRVQYHVHLVLAATIFLGGIGFPVVLGYYNYLRHVWTGIRKEVIGIEDYRHAPRVVNVSIRLMLYPSLILLVIGFLAYLFFEGENTLRGLSGYGRWVTALFGAVTVRTAGFNTVDVGGLALPTILLYLLLMWIGASPGSTGGGLKTSTLAVAILNIVSLAKGKDRVEVFQRQISQETIRKAFAVILLSFLMIGLGVFLVLLFDPQLPLLAVAFEVFSAFSTVGLSLGITPDLSSPAKMTLVVLMFIGRVGMLTVLVALVRKARTLNYNYPEEGVFIT